MSVKFDGLAIRNAVFENVVRSAFRTADCKLVALQVKIRFLIVDKHEDCLTVLFKYTVKYDIVTVTGLTVAVGILCHVRCAVKFQQTAVVVGVSRVLGTDTEVIVVESKAERLAAVNCRKGVHNGLVLVVAESDNFFAIVKRTLDFIFAVGKFYYQFAVGQFVGQLQLAVVVRAVVILQLGVTTKCDYAVNVEIVEVIRRTGGGQIELESNRVVV